MAAPEQIEQIAAMLRATNPTRFFTHMNKSHAGIGAVLYLLSQSTQSVTAGNVAEYIDVSTARVAALLKKMEAKGLILRQRDPSDARVTIVRLTDDGRQVNACIQAELDRRVGEVIDRVGMERMLEFMATAMEIRDILMKPDPLEFE